jgi:hypothetical protein
MKSQIDSFTYLINEDQKLYGLCFNDTPDLYNEMVNLSYPQTKRYSSSRTSISNTEILFGRSSSQVGPKELDLETNKKSLYQKLLISHDSKIKSIFDILVLIIINISSLIILYDFCFKETDDDIDLKNELFSNTVIYYIIEGFFAIFIILQFFQTYQDPATLLIITDFKHIAFRYIKSWFIIDFLSIIPYELLVKSYKNSGVKYIKMIRLIRLPKFIQTIDVKRFDNLATSFLTKGESENASKRIMVIFNVRYFFKIIRLMIMASIVAYVLGCVWYLISLQVFQERFKMGYPEESTFFTEYKLYKKPPLKRLALSCYYVLTGLTTVGYGDFNAQNQNEKIFGITVMFLGVTIFSYVMSEFSDQINVYNRTFGERDQDSALNNHFNLLRQFCPNQPFDDKLIQNISKHFKFFWKNNRMHSIDKNDKYLSSLPKDLKISLVEYFWYDIFAKFNNFLLYRKYKMIYYKFYYELSFLLMPRLFSKDEIIYQLGDEVEELYLIMEGMVSANYGKHKDIIHHKTNFYSGNTIGVYYCLYNLEAEYECITEEESKLYSINKIEFLKLVKNYPEIEEQMREMQYNSYKNFKNRMDNGIRKEINEYNNNIDDEDNKIEFKSKKMIDFNKNKNGMTINNFLENEIKKRNDEIKKLDENLNKKFKESKLKFKEFRKRYNSLIEQYKEKYQLI